MRVIDADALLERMKKDPLFPLVERYGVSGVINAEPTVDAVEVVRCKDCKYCIYPAPRKWEKHDVKHPPYCDWWIDCGDGFDVEENDFCCHAERKEESNERADHQI